MEGVQNIEEVLDRQSMSNSIWSRKFRKNAVLSAEVSIVNDLVEAVEDNMRGYDEDKIKKHMNCHKVWELLTSSKAKASQFAGYG